METASSQGGLLWRELLQSVYQASPAAAYQLLLLYCRGTVDVPETLPAVYEAAALLSPPSTQHGAAMLRLSLAASGLSSEDTASIAAQHKDMLPDDETFRNLVSTAHTDISAAHTITDVVAIDTLVTMLLAADGAALDGKAVVPAVLADLFSTSPDTRSPESTAMSSPDKTTWSPVEVLRMPSNGCGTVWQFTDTQLTKLTDTLVKEVVHRSKAYASLKLEKHSLHTQLQRATGEAKRWKLLLKRSLLDHAETKERALEEIRARDQQHNEELNRVVVRMTASAAVRAVAARAEAADMRLSELSKPPQLLADRDVARDQTAGQPVTGHRDQDQVQSSPSKLQRACVQRELEQQQLLHSRTQLELEQEQLHRAKLQRDWERERLECTRQQRLRMQLDLDNAARLQAELEQQVSDLRAQLADSQKQVSAANAVRLAAQGLLHTDAHNSKDQDPAAAKYSTRHSKQVPGQVCLPAMTAFATACGAAQAAMGGDSPEQLLALPPTVPGTGTGLTASVLGQRITEGKHHQVQTPSTVTTLATPRDMASECDGHSTGTADTPVLVVVSSPSVGDDLSPPMAATRAPLPHPARSRSVPAARARSVSTLHARSTEGVSFSRLPSKTLRQGAMDSLVTCKSVDYRARNDHSVGGPRSGSGIVYTPLAMTRSVPTALEAAGSHTSISVAPDHPAESEGSSGVGIGRSRYGSLVKSTGTMQCNVSASALDSMRDTELCRDNSRTALGCSLESITTIQEDDSPTLARPLAGGLVADSKTAPLHKVGYGQVPAALAAAQGVSKSYNGRHTLSPNMHSGQEAGKRSRAGLAVPRKVDFGRDSLPTLPHSYSGSAGAGQLETPSQTPSGKLRAPWSMRRSDWELALLPQYTQLHTVTSIAETDEAPKAPEEKKKSLSRRVRSSFNKLMRRLTDAVSSSQSRPLVNDPKVVASAVWLTTNTSASMPY